MKKFFVIFLSSLFIFCSFVIPVSAESVHNFQEIAQEQNITWSEKYVVCSMNGNYHILLCGTNSINQYRNGALGNSSTNALNLRYYTVPVSNPYSTWTSVPVISGGYQVTGTNGQPINFSSAAFYNSSATIYNTDGTVFFQQSLLMKNQILETSISQQTIQGILNELIAILPVSIVTLVTFIAIRKGLKFVLTTLRQA